jgi:hypothetical protein
MWVMEQFEFLTLLDDDAEPQQPRPSLRQVSRVLHFVQDRMPPQVARAVGSVLGGPEAALGLDSVSNLDELTGVFDDLAISSW